MVKGCSFDHQENIVSSDWRVVLQPRKPVGYFFAVNMAKDPAFLFYHQDFFTGVSDMTNEEVGAYIRCLCIQASKGGISEKHMKNICVTHEVHSAIKVKFIFDPASELFFNERLKSEIEKRKKYSESRANNRKNPNKEKSDMKNISDTYVRHMENENENEVENEVKKEKPKKEKSEKPTNQIPIIQMEELWSKFLSDHHSVSYYASAKERVALKAIAKQLLFQVGQKEAQTGQISNKTDADKVLEAWGYVLSKFDRWSDFHKNLKALSAINSQLTTILSDSKNGANKQKSNGPLDPAKVAANYFRSRGLADPIDRVPSPNGPNETFDADYQIVD